MKSQKEIRFYQRNERSCEPQNAAEGENSVGLLKKEKNVNIYKDSP